MIIAPQFIWLHFPKCAGQTVEAALRVLAGGRADIHFDHSEFDGNFDHVIWHDSLNDRRKRQPGFSAAGKKVIMNIRRLPDWLLSQVHFSAQRHPGIPTREMITSGRFIEVDGSLWSADERLSYFIDDGIDEWIRSEHLLYDFERVFSPYFDLADGRHQKILKARRNEGAFYIRDLAHHFSAKELERVYLNNPKWAALEKRLYGDILTVPQEERPSLFARFRRKQKRKRTPKEMPPAMALLELADRHYHGDTAPPKSSLFWNEYHRLLADRREHPLRILELGVQNGSSLMVWQDYLPNATIVGLDVAERPERDLGERVHFVQGSQDDEDALDKAAELAGGPFDIIVDDAAHIGLLARRSFHHLFPRHLKPGGHYAIESYGTSFLPEYPDGQKFNAFPDETGTINSVEFPSHQNGMIGVVKQLIDEMNRGLATGQPSQFDISRITMLVNIAIIEKGRG